MADRLSTEVAEAKREWERLHAELDAEFGGAINSDSLDLIDRAGAAYKRLLDAMKARRRVRDSA